MDNSIPIASKGQLKIDHLLGVYNLSGLVAHRLSGLESPQEVTYETDRGAAGDTENAIRGCLLWLAGRALKSAVGGNAFGSMRQELQAI